MRQSDVLIVGAGPAGAWAARHLAGAGARVRLFDDSHPREKPCGGGLTGRALDIVRPVVDAERLRGVAVGSLRFESGSTVSSFPVPVDRSHGGSPLVIVDRATFDAALLDAAVRAGADHVAERVTDVTIGSDGVEVRTRSGRWTGDVLVGADGANSVVRRRLCRPFSRAQISIATGCFVHGVITSEVRINCVKEPPGYIWSFPRADHLAVGICAQADVSDVRRLRRTVSSWLAGSDLGAGARMTPYSWPIPSLSSADFLRESPAGSRWLLTGDAAGLVDPLTREGIYFALVSGQFAADAIIRGDPCAAYVERVREALYPELARAADLKVRFFTSGFTELLVQGLNRSAPIRRVMVDLVAGRQAYATLKGRLLRTFEVGLAWRLLLLQLAARGHLAR